MFPCLNPSHIGLSVPLVEGLALAESHGFGGYDAQLQAIHDLVAERGSTGTRDLFRAHGLRPGAWNLPYAPYHLDEPSNAAWVERLRPLVAAAASIGARRAAMWILPGHNDLPYVDNFTLHVARFQPVARLLDTHGIRLALEFIGPESSLRHFRHPFARTIPEMLELAHAIGPNVGLLLDAWHWHCTGGSTTDLSLLSRSNVVHVHVNDAPPGIPLTDLLDNRRRLPTTTGVIDLDTFMSALATAGYDGPVTAEPFDPEVNALPSHEALTTTARTTRSAVARAS